MRLKRILLPLVSLIVNALFQKSVNLYCRVGEDECYQQGLIVPTRLSPTRLPSIVSFLSPPLHLHLATLSTRVRALSAYGSLSILLMYDRVLSRSM
jgi:hypothetical protein